MQINTHIICVYNVHKIIFDARVILETKLQEKWLTGTVL